jgi:hypothetical protein
MSEEAKEPRPKIVTADNKTIGSAGETLWHDARGFDIVTVHGAGADVVIPLIHGQVDIGGRLPVTFSADEVRQAPTVAELAARGGAAAIRLVADHYDVSLAGPPPGPGTTKLPPWWTKVEDAESTKDKER